MTRLFALFLIPLLVADSPARSRDQQAIIDHGKQWSALYQAGKIEEMRPLYEPDAWLMTNNAPVAKGVDAILAYINRNKASGNKVSFQVEPEQITVDGRYGFLISCYWMPIERPKETVITSGRSMLVFKRRKAGTWRIWRDMDNKAPDVPPTLQFNSCKPDKLDLLPR